MERRAYFLAEASPAASVVLKRLADGAYRCNVMMLGDGGHALALLREERAARGAAPSFVLISGGLHDGRAAALIESLRADELGRSIELVVVRGPAGEADGSPQALPLPAFEPSLLEPLLGPGFWWALVALA